MSIRLVVVPLVCLAACSSGTSSEPTDPVRSTLDTAAPSVAEEVADDFEQTADTGRTLVIDGPAQVESDGDQTETADTTVEEPAGTPLTVDTAGEADPEVDGPVAGASGCDGLPRGITELTIDAGGTAHPVRVFVPERLLATPAPVVIDWHGLGGDGAGQAAYTGYETVAAEEGFIVVHPTGVPRSGDDRNSWELTTNDDVERDDLAFADALIDAMTQSWCGDVARIYSTGFSNGGFFTAELICHRSERIAAAVSVAGLAHPTGCAPQRPVPYVAYHGTDDVVVPIDGGGTSPLADDPFGANGLFDPSIRAEFAEFAAANGCTADPVRTVETDDVTRYVYDGCDEGVPMVFFELTGSGHSWPGSPVAGGASATLGYHTFDVDATRDAWAFFEQHSLS